MEGIRQEHRTRGAPKGIGKQSGSPDQKVELRNLNPESMRRFFNSETYAKGSGNKGEPTDSEEHPKGSGKQSQGKGSGKSAGPAEEHPKGSGKPSKGKGDKQSKGKGGAEGIRQERRTSRGAPNPRGIRR